VIRFGDQEVYPVAVDESGLARLSAYMKGTDVRINADYTT
ncbi:MAG: ornithine acetyltransferase, partial [Acidimicrobiia bacterium]|nr:ornithine acetyltransferase [Acidimicrobiia bacterium]